MGFHDHELLPVNRILGLQVDFVHEILGQSEVIFVDAESILMLVQNVFLLLLEFIWNLEVASFLNVIPGKSFPLHFREASVNIMAV